MKDFFGDLGKKITKTAETVGKKTDEVVEVQKIRSQIRTLEKTNERDFFDLGKMVYEHYKKGDVIDGESAVICEEISKREEAIEGFENQEARVKGMTICPSCQTKISKDVAFCPKCGAKNEKEETVEPEVAEAEVAEAEVAEVEVVEPEMVEPVAVEVAEADKESEKDV